MELYRVYPIDFFIKVRCVKCGRVVSVLVSDRWCPFCKRKIKP